MKKEVLYSEVQRFTQFWIWIPIFAVNGFVMFGVYKQMVLGELFLENSFSNRGLLLFFVFMVLFMVFFIFMKLETIVSRDGIFVRFFPIHLKYRFFKWDDVDKAYIRKYNAIFEYGGWGIKYSLGGKGKAYNVSGNMGLQIEFKNGEKILIGTKNPDKLRYVFEDSLKFN
ncbi:MAG: hypothetical protein ACM3PT_07495 [Deltaproteobacteria bacterium]